MEALLKTSDRNLRAILIALCDDSSVRRKAIEFFNNIQQFTTRDEPETGGSTKRKAEIVNIGICIQCRDAFDEDNNGREDCLYHPDVMEPDYNSDAWADHDENIHGIIDSEELREMYPEGYTWQCCEKNGEEDGCTRGPHLSNPEVSKKGRYENVGGNLSAGASGEEDENETANVGDQEGEDEDEE